MVNAPLIMIASQTVSTMQLIRNSPKSLKRGAGVRTSNKKIANRKTSGTVTIDASVKTAIADVLFARGIRGPCKISVMPITSRNTKKRKTKTFNCDTAISIRITKAAKSDNNNPIVRLHIRARRAYVSPLSVHSSVPGACGCVSLTAHPILRLASATAFLLTSPPTNPRPSFFAATSVVPLPQKKSATTPSGGQSALISRSKSSSGFCVG